MEEEARAGGWKQRHRQSSGFDMARGSQNGGWKVGPPSKERTKGTWRSWRSHPDSSASCLQAVLSIHRRKHATNLSSLHLFSATFVTLHMCDPFLKPGQSASILKTQAITLKTPNQVHLVTDRNRHRTASPQDEASIPSWRPHPRGKTVGLHMNSVRKKITRFSFLSHRPLFGPTTSICSGIVNLLKNQVSATAFLSWCLSTGTVAGWKECWGNEQRPFKSVDPI